jgi:hypothetical protein
MFTTITPHNRWSTIGLRVLIGSILVAVATSILEGILKGPLEISGVGDPDARARFVMFATWVVDARYLAEQAVYAATIFFVGAKFFETRTMLTVGFESLDKSKISVKGPDENNVVWIGQRYATPVEAQAVAEAFTERLKNGEA